MEMTPMLLEASVMHKRLHPQSNGFTYPTSFLVLPLDCLEHAKSSLRFAIDKFGFLSFLQKDHGPKDGSSLKQWANRFQQEHGLSEDINNVILVAMPRVWGFAFKPVSFWFFLDGNDQMKAVICEVNNTFGETHSYLCEKVDKGPIDPQDHLLAEKKFHVSPFMGRTGHYRFRFSFTAEKLSVFIDLYDEQNRKQLITSVSGRLRPMKKDAGTRSLSKHSISTLGALVLIHWQALRLFCKGAKFFTKPSQLLPKLSKSSEIMADE